MGSREEHIKPISNPPSPSSDGENNIHGHKTTSTEKAEGGEMIMRRRVKVILVGCGRMGHVRAKHIYASPRFLLLAIIDVDISKAKALASYYSTNAFESISEAVEFCWSLDESKGLSPLDAIIISTPTPTHETLIQEASRFVPFVLTEKPVGETADNIAHLFRHCQTLGVTLCCSFQRRFDRAYVSMQQAITNHGQFGRPIQAHVVFGDHPSPPPIHFLLHGGGNIYSDLLPHDLDYLRWCFLADDEISTVYATGSSSTEELRLADVHDRATVVVIFQSGAVATFILSRFSAYGYDQRCEIWGQGGMRLSVQSVHDHSSIVADNTGIHLSKLLPSFPQRFDAAFAAELEAFADTILSGKPWPITSKDCIAVQRVCDAAKASSDLNIPIHLENLPINASRN